MTREEAIAVLKGLSDNPLFSTQHKATFNIAIHDIKAFHDWNINNLILVNKDNYEPIEQEPKTGCWIMSDDGLYRPICDKCGAHPWKGYIPTVEEATEVFKYCPNCGCRMFEPQESGDKCKNCEYYHNPDYTRCHKCKAESEGEE